MTEFKLTFEDGSNGYLKHFGVKGMHWGVWNEETRQRRLGLHTQKNSNNRPVLQRLGIVKDPQRNKERYRRMSDEGTTYTKDGLNLEKGSKTDSLENRQALGYLDKSEATTKEFQRLSASAKKLDDEYNKHRDLATKAYYKTIEDSSTKKEALKRVKKDLTDYGGDPDFVNLVAYEAVDSVIRQKTRSTPEGKKVIQYENQLNDWFSDVKSTTDRLVGEVGNKTIKTKHGNTDYEKVVKNTLLKAQGDRGFLAYAARNGVLDEVNGNMARTEDLVEAVSVQFMKSVGADPKELYWLRNDPKEYD